MGEPIAIQLARRLIPLRRRRQLARARVTMRLPTAGLRDMPNVLIIGAQRGGTSSLYRALLSHPDVVRPLRKEIEFFSEHHRRGERWYRAHYPVRGKVIRLDATPQYLLHPHAARRAAQLLPAARMIVLLRDPVERAYSHWRHMRSLGFEDLPFETALEVEKGRIGPDLQRLLVEPDYRATTLMRYSYAIRGRYVEQLARWMRHYPREQFLVLPSEFVFADPTAALDRILRFLGIHSIRLPFLNVSRVAASPEPPPSARAVANLRQYFEDANSGLRSLVDVPPPWAPTQ